MNSAFRSMYRPTGWAKKVSPQTHGHNYVKYKPIYIFSLEDSSKDHFTANIVRNIPANKFWKSIKIWQNYGHEFVASLFWFTLYISITVLD